MTTPKVHAIAPELVRMAVPIANLKRHPRNARKGNVEAIADSLAEFGQVRPVLVQKSTGYIVAGNHTVDAAVLRGWTHVAATRQEMTDEKALAYLVADNRLSDLAKNDDAALVAILAELDADGLLSGTGFAQTDLDELRRSLDNIDRPQEPAPTEAPLAGPGGPVIQYSIIFDNEAQQHAFYDFLRMLKDRYPDTTTVAGRIAEHIDTVMVAPA